MRIRAVAAVAVTLAVTAPALSPVAPGLAGVDAARAAQPADSLVPVAAKRSAKVQGWRRPLDRRAARGRGQRLVFGRTFETVGVAWTGSRAPSVEVRTRANGTWTHWQEADEMGGQATEPVWVGPSTAVEVRVDRYRRGLEVVLVSPGERSADARAGSTTQAAHRADAGGAVVQTAAYTARPAGNRKNLGHAPKPRTLSRDRWGANEKWRGSKPVYLDTIKQAHVHHTAGSTSYKRRDVPGILRSMYWYHTKQLGWSDLGYNFLVDRFGRVWEGRYGGIRKKVRGAHTLGFNHVSFGVAAIGNFEKASPSKRLRGGLVKLIAWKLDVANRNARNKTRIWSSGSDRYKRGARPRLPVLDGHRDTNYTACPGANLYDRLPGIRHRVQKRANQWNWD